MLVRPFARHNGCPQHGGQHWLQSGKVAAYSALDELSQGWHLTALKQRINHFPIRRIPTNQEYFFSNGLRHTCRTVE